MRVRIGPKSLLTALVAALCATFVVAAAPAGAVTHPIGYVETARQNTVTHVVTVTGWTYDPARPGRSLMVDVYIDGVHTSHAKADVSRKDIAARKHITGRHGFVVSVHRTGTAKVVTVKVHYANDPAHTLRLVYHKKIAQITPKPAATPGQRVVAIAKKYVGGRYVDGGTTPAGFDCSGYTMWAYSHAHVASLPHLAQAQRTAAGMHTISRSQAKPGDLIFYLDGNYAYHVAIYAGGNMQYAAATPQDGIVYQQIWSSAIVFTTDWH